MGVLTLIIATFFALGNDSSEQIAFNYFASEIINKTYSDSKVIYFSGQTESEESIAGPFARCFESDADFSQFYYQHKKSDYENILIEFEKYPRVQKSSKIKSKQLNLKVYRAVTKGQTDYVYIKVFKVKNFVDHYLMKISSGKVVDVCHMNEVI